MQHALADNIRGRFLPLVLILAGASVAAIGLGADILGIGGPQGIGPRQVALALSGIAVFLAGIVIASSANWRHIGEWLFVVLAAIAVTFASDLLVINGLPELGAKNLVLASVGIGVILTAAVPSATFHKRKIGDWLNWFTLNRVQIAKFVSLAAQLGVLVLLVREFQLENQVFYINFMRLTFYSFLIHYFLPSRYRLPFFLMVSLAAIAGILGFVNAAWLIAIGLGLIGLCHLRVLYSIRVALLLAAGAILAALRVNWLPAAWLNVIWPVLASMFMFRLIIYVYDLKHSKATPTVASTLSYFFLLPNIVFPFFPLVDYSTFRRTYYDEDQYQIYQKGMKWMLRGVIQLIIYRYVNYYLALAPQDVANTTDLVRYLIANFALYLRISGMFHIIIGLLHLFGFNLPETHHLYFLASSFTDLWRRINIYWKDFMLKVFYYPIYFRIRHWGPTASLVAATSLVFVLTWFFHAYQWFWLRGSFLLTAPDMLFWFILAVLVVANTVYEANRGRKRSIVKHRESFGDVIALAFRSAATFSIMAILWSLWSSESVRDWLSLFSVVQLTWENVAILFASFAMIAVLSGLAIWIGKRTEKNTKQARKQPVFFTSAAVTGGSIFLLFLIGNPIVTSRLDSNARTLISDLTVNRLSDREAALLQRGYYEDLIGVDQFNSQLWEIYTRQPADWPPITETVAARQTGDNLIVELVPSTTLVFHGAQLSINRWGMRDRDYELVPAHNTYRIALTGPSFVMGSGVADNEVFEWLLEDRLNREYGGSRYAGYEILNFAVPGYSALQDLMVLERKALPFHPNALLFMAHQREGDALVAYLADRFAVGAELPYPDLNALADRAGVRSGETKGEIERKLKPFGDELTALTYRHIVEVSRAHGILPVWVFIPTLEAPMRPDDIAHLSDLADEAGFIVLNLANAYENQEPESLVVAYWDKHPNASGHALIAEKLYQALRDPHAVIPLFP